MRFSQIPPWLAKKVMRFTRKQTLHSIESSKSSHVMGDRENKLSLCPSFFPRGRLRRLCAFPSGGPKTCKY